MKSVLFTGSAVAIVTPFNQDETINFNKLGELIEFQIKNGTQAIIICGTTGESSTLSDEEHKDAIKYAVDFVKGRIPVIAGTGSNDTKYAIYLSQYAQEAGADAILSVTPYYNKTSQDGLYEHFKQIADSVRIPVILYNVPSRTGVNINPETLYKLSKISNIVAVKECNLGQIIDIVELCGDDLTIYTGNDNEILPSLSLGGKGVISVIANIIPRETQNIVRNYLDGNTKEATSLQIKINKINKAIFCDVSPVPVKEAMNIMGLDVGGCRMPLVRTSEKNIELITKNLAEYGLIKLN
jgi:4-hydroxy-tetrahydrodipicolinate synthase